MTEPESTQGYAVHRIAALTDGIYAVAMTLLVIERKLPEHEAIQGSDELINAVARLSPKFLAWFISFFVLAMFWLGNLRVTRHLRSADGPLMALFLVQLGCVSLMPFSSALAGEFPKALFSQIFYSANMATLALLALLIARHAFRHPELTITPVLIGAFRASRFRTLGVVVVSVVAVGIAIFVPGDGNMAFLLMLVIMPIGRRIERRVS